MNSALHTLNCSNEPQLLLYFGLDVWIITVLWVAVLSVGPVVISPHAINLEKSCSSITIGRSVTILFVSVLKHGSSKESWFIWVWFETYEDLWWQAVYTGAAASVGEMLLIERLGNTIFKSVHSYIRFLSKLKYFNNINSFAAVAIWIKLHEWIS